MEHGDDHDLTDVNPLESCPSPLGILWQKMSSWSDGMFVIFFSEIHLSLKKTQKMEYQVVLGHMK